MSNKYTIEFIQQYLKGELKKEEVYQLEKDALNDPLLSDMIAGYEIGFKKAGYTRIRENLNEIKNYTLESNNNFGKRKKNIFVFGAVGIVIVILGIIGWNDFSTNNLAEAKIQVSEEKEISTVPVHDLLLEEYSLDIILTNQKNNPITDKEITIYNQIFKTDEKGKITIRPLKTGTSFNINILGYKTQQIYIPQSFKDLVKVQLTEGNPDQDNINIAKERLYAPEGGWYKFQSFVDANKNLPSNNLFLKGSVIVKATLSSNHSLTEIEVVQSINKEYDAEAIRLIKIYDAWKNKMSAPIVVFLEVIF